MAMMLVQVMAIRVSAGISRCRKGAGFNMPFKPTEVSWTTFAALYCETQDQTPDGLAAVLRAMVAKYRPEGFFLARCIVLDSSRLGERNILPYGPNNTFKVIPDRPFSPRGLASDISEVECFIPASAVSIVSAV